MGPLKLPSTFLEQPPFPCLYNRFYFDEDTKWVLGSASSLGNASAGPFGVPAPSLKVSCPTGCR